jgi:hypothetical protein
MHPLIRDWASEVRSDGTPLVSPLVPPWHEDSHSHLKGNVMAFAGNGDNVDHHCTTSVSPKAATLYSLA